MSIELIRESLGEHARDIRVNLSNVLTEEGSPGLTLRQIQSIALSSVYSLGASNLIESFEHEFAQSLSKEDIAGAKAAASIMGMNNIYYRFMHLAEDEELSKLPAKLRMQVIGKPPVDKQTFELMCLGVSALAGCGNCIKSHVHEVVKSGISKEGAQSTARIASVINAVHVSLRIPV